MIKTPKSLRLQLGLFGRTNVGKSSFLNLVLGQDFAITSEIAGTTTDVVEKTMELLPIGPVVFLDTAGVDDVSDIASLRMRKTHKILDRADIIILVAEPNIWSEYEQSIINEAKNRDLPVVIAINKTDLKKPSKEFINKIKTKANYYFLLSSIDILKRDHYLGQFKDYIIRLCPQDFISPPPLIGDLMPPKGLAILIVPIDLEAPKGRIILPQVQAIRDCLDNQQAALVLKESEYPHFLKKLKDAPDLVVCDSQVVDTMVENTPPDVDCTTFSILFARYKGDLSEAVAALKVIPELQDGDKILIAESCSHHPIEDDIGRRKIPSWLKGYTGLDLKIESCAGRDYPDNLSQYQLIIHCGGCMIGRREMLARIQQAKAAGVAITNYGVVISYLHNVLAKVISPFKDIIKNELQLKRGINERRTKKR